MGSDTSSSNAASRPGSIVGYQACDTATEQAGQTDFFRCASNAKAFARNLKVVGVVGTWESFCADVQIPIANGAPQGPLAMLGPSNTADYLTLEDVMYPSGIRNYTRIVPPNRYQGSAQAGLAKALGAPNAFLLTAVDNVFDAGFSDEIRKTADAIGVPLIADREYDWTDVDPKALAAEVASAAPGAVIIVGVPDVETGEFIRTLRLALPPGTPVILPDVFAEADRLVELLGPAAQGVYVTVYGSRTATCRNAVAHSSRTSSAGVADRRDRILGPRTVPRPPRSSSTRSAGPTVRVLQSHARCSRSRSTMDPRTHPFRRERRSVGELDDGDPHRRRSVRRRSRLRPSRSCRS